MAAIITTDFRLANAEAFVNSVKTNDNYYLVIGRPFTWADDVNPPVPVDNHLAPLQIWNESTGARKIQASEVILSAKRYNWTTGTVYAQYDSTINIASLEYYVLTSDYTVYKCINNNLGVASTVMPSGTGSAIFQTADGYQWKYLYTIGQADALKYLTTDYIPVRTDTGVAAAAIPGGVHNIKVTNGGAGYTTATVNVTGNGADLAATANISGGVITSITVTNPGTGYSIANITITGTGTITTTATAAAIISPPGGHGTAVESELKSTFVTLSNELAYSVNDPDWPTSNDYRRIALIRNPLLSDNTTAASGSKYNTSNVLSLEHLSGSTIITSDDTFTGGTSGAIVRSYSVEQTSASPLTNSVRIVQDLTQNSISVTNGEIVTSSSGGTWQVNSVTVPELFHGSGSIVFIEQRRPIMRALNQTENIIIIVEF